MTFEPTVQNFLLIMFDFTTMRETCELIMSILGERFEVVDPTKIGKMVKKPVSDFYRNEIFRLTL